MDWGWIVVLLVQANRNDISDRAMGPAAESIGLDWIGVVWGWIVVLLVLANRNYTSDRVMGPAAESIGLDWGWIVVFACAGQLPLVCGFVCQSEGG